MPYLGHFYHISRSPEPVAAGGNHCPSRASPAGLSAWLRSAGWDDLLEGASGGETGWKSMGNGLEIGKRMIIYDTYDTDH